MAHVVSIAFDVDRKSYFCLYRSLWSYPWDLTVGRECCYMQLHNASICTLCIVNHRLHQQMPSCPPFLYAHFFYALPIWYLSQPKRIAHDFPESFYNQGSILRWSLSTDDRSCQIVYKKKCRLSSHTGENCHIHSNKEICQLIFQPCTKPG